MPRTVKSNIEKLHLVLESMERNVVITKFCVQHNISRSSFYRWREMVEFGLSVAFSSKKRKPIKTSVPTMKGRPKRYHCRLK